MKKETHLPQRFTSLSEFHRVCGLPMPLHPLISLIDIKDMSLLRDELSDSFMLDFYKIAYKTNLAGRAKYGQHYYDFGEGGLVLTAPAQILETPDGAVKSGYILLIHPDYLLSYPLAKKIKQYGFFSYAANEALHLADSEKETILSIFKIIDDELRSRIDDFSHDVIISQVELLLNYCNRFYKRQFINPKSGEPQFAATTGRAVRRLLQQRKIGNRRHTYGGRSFGCIKYIAKLFKRYVAVAYGAKRSAAHTRQAY